MKNNIKISIVTICYNSEATIEDCILSVISQGYPNLEYIVVDGKSTDSTMTIVDHYKDSITTIVSEKDKGISDAFNKGIARATGEVLCFINSDDVMLPGSLQAVADAFDGKHDIYSANVILDNIETGHQCREIPSLHFPTMPFFKHVSHQGRFVTLDLYRKIGGYDTELRYTMDLDFLVRATHNGARFKHVAFDVARFRSGGVTSTDILKKKKDFVRLVTNNNGNMLQALTYYYFIVTTQYVKKFLSAIGGKDMGQKLRYKTVS